MAICMVLLCIFRVRSKGLFLFFFKLAIIPATDCAVWCCGISWPMTFALLTFYCKMFLVMMPTRRKCWFQFRRCAANTRHDFWSGDLLFFHVFRLADSRRTARFFFTFFAWCYYEDFGWEVKDYFCFFLGKSRFSDFYRSGSSLALPNLRRRLSSL